MAAPLRYVCISVLLLLVFFLAIPLGAQQTALETLAPQETLIITDFACAAVCRDFSPLLKDLNVEWLILPEGERLTSSTAADKDLLLVGALSSPTMGPILRDLLSNDEIARVENDGWAVTEKEHPWDSSRIMMLAIGSDHLDAKSAAENAVTGFLEAAPSKASWFREAQVESREELRTTIAQIQHPTDGGELSIEALTANLDESRHRSVSAEEAAEDVSYLFNVLKDGWCGYGTFEGQGDFTAAREDILRQLASQDRWRPAELAALIREELSFIHDCHLKVGDVQYCSHLDFWYDESLSFWPADAGYHFDYDGVDHQLLQVNGKTPDGFLFASLDEAGEPIYRLGMLSYDKPAPLRLSATDGDSPVQIEISLSTANYYPREQFGEERLGGIPVIRARSFSDYYDEEMREFVSKARNYRGEPYLILDIRGNGGGNTRWPKNWIRGFTGQTPSLNQALTELVSRTTMMGRANLFAEMQLDYPESKMSWLESEQNRNLSRARQLESGSEASHWSYPIIPNIRVIPNDTTLIVVVDRAVSSAGEGLLSYLQDQVENVMVVGENTNGALTFGQISLHQLPNSRLKAYVPIKLNVQMDLAQREERGFEPDLWLPPNQALNYVIAAARRGTITSRVAVPEDYFAEPFTPEDTGVLNLLKLSPQLLPLVIILGVFALASIRMSPQHRFFIGAGISLIMLGVLYVVRFDQPLGFAAIGVGTSSLVRGLYLYLRQRTGGAISALNNGSQGSSVHEEEGRGSDHPQDH